MAIWGLPSRVAVGGADDGVVGDPVGVLGEEVGAAAEGVAALGEILDGAEVFFAAAARIGELEAGVVADGGEVAAVEEGAGVGELGALAAVAEAARVVADVEVHVHLLAGGEGLIERVDGVEIALGGGDFVEGAIELDVGDGLLSVDDVDLGDGVGGFVLEDEVAGAGEGAALGEDVDVGVDGDDLGLREVLILLEVALVVGLDVALLRLAEEFVEDVGVVEVPGAAADGDEEKQDAGGDEAGARWRKRRRREAKPSSVPRTARPMEMTPRKAAMESQ